MYTLRVVNSGFNYSQDGPGNRLVYHLLGCNMRCPWCSNADAIDPAGLRVELPKGGGRWNYREIAAEEVLRQAQSARKIFVEGGGVTFSGGEPTLQAEALLQVLAALREAGIHTALETNGSSPRLAEFLPLLSLLIVDLKHYDDALHTRYTGISNKQVLQNIRTACQAGGPVWVRTPLVNGFNAGEEDIAGFLAIYKSLPTVNTSFELLRYHEYGRDKWEKCGLEYRVKNGAVSEARARQFEEAYRAAGLRVINT